MFCPDKCCMLQWKMKGLLLRTWQAGIRRPMSWLSQLSSQSADSLEVQLDMQPTPRKRCLPRCERRQLARKHGRAGKRQQRWWCCRYRFFRIAIKKLFCGSVCTLNESTYVHTMRACITIYDCSLSVCVYIYVYSGIFVKCTHQPVCMHKELFAWLILRGKIFLWLKSSLVRVQYVLCLFCKMCSKQQSIQNDSPDCFADIRRPHKDWLSWPFHRRLRIVHTL